MPKERLINYLRRSLRWVEEHRLFRPWRHHFAKRALWSLDRRAIALGVATGLFFGVTTPVAQIVFATLAAILLRANLVVAAGSTLVTNPITFPFIYYGAFQIGSALTGSSREIVEDVEVSAEAATRALEVERWFSTLADWFSQIGYPLLVGLVSLALALSVLGYVLVYAVWGVIALLRRAGLGGSRAAGDRS